MSGDNSENNVNQVNKKLSLKVRSLGMNLATGASTYENIDWAQKFIEEVNAQNPRMPAPYDIPRFDADVASFYDLHGRDPDTSAELQDHVCGGGGEEAAGAMY